MSRKKPTATAAIRALRAHGVAFTSHVYTYEEHGGSRAAAEQLGVDEHAVVKTLIMEDDGKNPLVVLMHGDEEVSTKRLARHLGVKSVRPCTPEVAGKHSGYVVGGTSPFGTRKRMPVHVQRTILDLERIFVNGGRRGLLVELCPSDLAMVLDAVPVDIRTG
jgi:Cys-tRNA(Pro) deacylase